MKKIIRLTEGDLHRIVENTVRKALNEVNVGNGDIDFSDLHITHLSGPNEDGYYEFEAKFDDDWYMLTGVYFKGDIEYDSFLSGHSGYGHPVTLDERLRDWLDENVSRKLVREIERRISRGMVDEPNDYSW